MAKISDLLAIMGSPEDSVRNMILRTPYGGNYQTSVMYGMDPLKEYYMRFGRALRLPWSSSMGVREQETPEERMQRLIKKAYEQEQIKASLSQMLKGGG